MQYVWQYQYLTLLRIGVFTHVKKTRYILDYSTTADKIKQNLAGLRKN